MMANKDGRRRFGNIRKLPSGRYQATYIGPDGFRRSGPRTFKTDADARRWLTLTEADVLKGEWVAPEGSEILLAPYAERWLRERKLAPKTREIYESIYNLNIKGYLGHLALGAIKPATVRTWRTRLLDEGRPEPQAVKAYRLLRAVLNTAVKEDELLKSNPCRIKGFDKYHTPERHTPSMKEVRALAEEMPAQFYGLIMLAAYSGLRWGELAALRRRDIDLEAGTVRVHRNLVSVRGQLVFGPPKSEAGKRTVHLPSAAIEVMRHHLRFNMRSTNRDELLFSGIKGAPLRSSSFHRAVEWAGAVEAAGLPKGFHFHDLRHFGNALASEAGASTKELMHRLGQSTMRAALIYQHATRKRDKEIAAGIDKRLAEAQSEDDEDDDDDGSSGTLLPVG